MGSSRGGSGRNGAGGGSFFSTSCTTGGHAGGDAIPAASVARTIPTLSDPAGSSRCLSGRPLAEAARAVTSYHPPSGQVTLAIDDLGPGDEGEYACKAENPWGDTTCTLVDKATGLPH